LFIPEYDETARGNKIFRVHETYVKYLPAILKDELSRMSCKNIHLSMETGRAGLQQKQKPNLSIYIDVTLAKRHGLCFLHCSNDVIMCPGDKGGFIAPFFFHEIRNKHTGRLITFIKYLSPVVEKQSGEAVEEVELPPPAGATGFEQGNHTKQHV